MQLLDNLLTLPISGLLDRAPLRSPDCPLGSTLERLAGARTNRRRRGIGLIYSLVDRPRTNPNQTAARVARLFILLNLFGSFESFLKSICSINWKALNLAESSSRSIRSARSAVKALN